MKKFLRSAACAAFALGLSTNANAVTNAPIPANATINFGGLQWAWAIPLPGSGFANALSYQGTLGWRLPTAAELAAAPLATNFIFAGANVPLGGADAVGNNFQAPNAALTGAAACASAYFNTGFNHCDWQDGKGQPFGPWAGSPGAQSFAEQLYVRAIAGAIPESSTWMMMIAGFGFAGAALRRRSAKVRFAL